jgi:DNA-binding GntR family transcriptional regulator
LIVYTASITVMIELSGSTSPASSLRRTSDRSTRLASHADTVYTALKEAILSGALGPGAPLREEALGRSHAVSRTPVREALSRLEREGLASRHARSGLVVSTINADEILDLYVLRETLEGLVARLVTERRTEIDLTRLDLIVAGAEKALREGDLERARALGSEFHFVLRNVANNRPLARALNDVQQSTQRYGSMLSVVPGRAEQSLAEHIELLEAIRSRDEAAAERSARQHVRQVRNLRLAFSLEHELAPETRPQVD